jgi:hypothetical protein
MADTKIERKGPTLWPWVLVLLAVFIGGWWWLERDAPGEVATDAEGPGVTVAQRGDGAAAIPAGTTGLGSDNAPVVEYMRYSGTAAGAPGVPAMSVEHDYTAEGIRRLASALEAVAQRRDGTARETADRLRAIADRIQDDSQSMGHAALVHEAFAAAAEAIASLPHRPADADLQAIANSIDPGRPLLSQEEAVRTFLRRSAEALDAASRD